MPNNNLEYHVTQKLYWAELVVKYENWEQVVKHIKWFQTPEALAVVKERLKDLPPKYWVHCIVVAWDPKYWAVVYQLNGSPYEIVVLWVADMEEKKKLSFRERREFTLNRWLQPPRLLTTTENMSEDMMNINWVKKRFRDVWVYPLAYKLKNPYMRDTVVIYIEEKE